MPAALPAALLAVVFAAQAPTRFPDADALPSRPEPPDPLVMFDGTPVKTRADWFDRRRPELKALFAHYMYGHAPPAPAKVEAAVEREDRAYFGGKATKKELALSFGPPGTPKVHLLLIVPNGQGRQGRGQAPAPVFLGLNFHGNYAAVDDPTIPLPTGWVPRGGKGVKDNRATDAGRGSQADVWQAERVIGRGYALATFYAGDVAPDRPGPAAEGETVQRSYPGYDWGHIAAWAWGLSRAADYLVTDPDVDKTRIAVVGHSRMGKTALLAAAFDERFALVIPHQSGTGGMAPDRATVGEGVRRINTNFPHWFNAEFKRFNDHPEKLPFDQNCLVALVAPRPILVTGATQDLGANPQGQLDMLAAAAPVYAFLGAGGLGTRTLPEPGTMVPTTLGFAMRAGRHAMNAADWTFFLDFADRHLGPPSKR
jgi:hypothetical protein